MPKVPEGYLHERRRHILAAASRVFSRKGVQAATMTEVATEAGISPGLIYRYFPSKEDLLASAMQESAQEVEARWMDDPGDGPDPMGEFLDLSERTFRILDDPSEQQQTILHVEQLLSALRDEDATGLQSACENWDQIVDKIRARLDAARARGQVDPGIDTQALAEVCFLFYWGARIRKMVSPGLDIGPAVSTYTKMIEAVADPPRARRSAN